MWFGLHLPWSVFWLSGARASLETRSVYLRWSPDADEALPTLPPLYTPFHVCLRSNARFVPITWNGAWVRSNKYIAELVCRYSAIECGKEPSPKAPVLHIKQYVLNVNVKVNLMDALVGYMEVGEKKDGQSRHLEQVQEGILYIENTYYALYIFSIYITCKSDSHHPSSCLKVSARSPVTHHPPGIAFSWPWWRAVLNPLSSCCYLVDSWTFA